MTRDQQEAVEELIQAAERAGTKAKMLYDAGLAARGDSAAVDECWAEFEALDAAIENAKRSTSVPDHVALARRALEVAANNPRLAS